MRSNNPRFANFCLAVLLACPWGVLFCVPIMIVGNQMIQPQEYLAVRTDGLLASTNVYAHNDWKTIDGTSIPRDPNHEFSTVYPSLPHTYDDTYHYKTDSWMSHMHVAKNYGEGDDAALWYFVRDRHGSGLTYFQKYSIPRRKSEGFIGTKGFRDSLPPPEERFQLPSYRHLGWAISPNTIAASQLSAGTWGSEYSYGPATTNYHMMTRDGAWWEIDFKSQTVRVILTGSKFLSYEFTGRFMPTRSDDESPRISKWFTKPILHARTEDEILLLDSPQPGKPPEERMRIGIPDAFRQKDIAWIHFPDESGMLVASLGYDSAANEDRHLIQRHDAAGKFSKPETIVLKRKPISTMLFSAIPVLIPPTVSGAVAASQWGFFGFSPQQSPEANLIKLLMLIPVLVGLICAGLVLMHARKNGLNYSEQIAYAIFGLLGGLPAVAGYLTHRRWGVRVRCPGCGRDVLLRGEKCSGCAAEFPQPEMVGTEVFA